MAMLLITCQLYRILNYNNNVTWTAVKNRNRRFSVRFKKAQSFQTKNQQRDNILHAVVPVPYDRSLPLSRIGYKMKHYLAIAFLIIFCSPSFASENNRSLNLTCQDYSWSDVELLVAPYLDDALFAALVMQGQSSDYKTSLAASQAMDKSLPHVIQRILRSIIEADC